jgi:hypothetical protein
MSCASNVVSLDNGGGSEVLSTFGIFGLSAAGGWFGGGVVNAATKDDRKSSGLCGSGASLVARACDSGMNKGLEG